MAVIRNVEENYSIGLELQARILYSSIALHINSRSYLRHVI
jgi:hypothetical protein